MFSICFVLIKEKLCIAQFDTGHYYIVMMGHGIVIFTEQILCCGLLAYLTRPSV